MTDQEINQALSKLAIVNTPALRVRNRIVRVDPHSVVVESERTRRARSIPFSALRTAQRVTRNGVIVRALAAAIGL